MGEILQLNIPRKTADVVSTPRQFIIINSCRSAKDSSLTVVFSIAGYPRVIPEPEVTRRLAKHRYSQLRIAPNPQIIHPKITRGFYPPISEENHHSVDFSAKRGSSSAKHPPSNLSERHFVDYIPSTEKKSKSNTTVYYLLLKKRQETVEEIKLTGKGLNA
ncbi:hypothetical protein TNCV_2798341 [Trichonephila clavipes]|nr:hypothetical protein TNCV_2798341 [Trichonephila clavipes]